MTKISERNRHPLKKVDKRMLSRYFSEWNVVFGLRTAAFDLFDKGQRREYAVDQKLCFGDRKQVIVVREGSLVACVVETFEQLMLHAERW